MLSGECDGLPTETEGVVGMDDNVPFRGNVAELFRVLQNRMHHRGSGYEGAS